MIVENCDWGLYCKSTKLGAIFVYINNDLTIQFLDELKSSIPINPKIEYEINIHSTDLYSLFHWEDSKIRISGSNYSILDIKLFDLFKRIQRLQIFS